MAAYIRLKEDAPVLDGASGFISREEYAESVEAREVLAAARAEAADLVERARQKYEEGFAAGYSDGETAAKQEYSTQILEVVSKSVDYLGQAEAQVSRAVMTCLRKILGEFPEEEIVVRAANTALVEMRNQPRVTLHVHPSVASELRGRVAEILRSDADVSFLDIVGDDSLPHGAVKLESDAGVVDASMNVQLAALEKVFSKTAR